MSRKMSREMEMSREMSRDIGREMPFKSMKKEPCGNAFACNEA